MSRSIEPTRLNDSSAPLTESGGSAATGVEATAAVSQTRPALREGAAEPNRLDEDEAPDTVRSPMWFVEE